MTTQIPKDLLIDHWFPITEAGIESVRERSVGQNPATNRLHVWFARRPLVASRAAILGSILPVDAPQETVHTMLGTPPGVDIKKAQEELDRAKASNIRLKRNPFTWERAYKHVPSSNELAQLKSMLKRSWGFEELTILDPMAGGGSIPYEAIRLGQSTIAGDLNPVAYVCLKGTVEYPARFREKLFPAVKDFCNEIHEEAKKELEEFFPKGPNERVYAYLWARTVRCSSCGLEIPLSPNWWIARTKDERIAVELSVPEEGTRCDFNIVEGSRISSDPDKGTVSGGDAECPRCHSVMSGEYIKAEAQAGRMGHQPYAVSTKIRSGKKSEWKFRAPTSKETEAFDKAAQQLKMKLPSWINQGIVPEETIPEGLKTREPLNFGMTRWCDLFNPRQLLAHLTYLEKFQEAKKQLFQGLQKDAEEYEFAKAVVTYGAMVFDTCITYDCILTRWAPDRKIIKSSMDIQAFPFRWSYAEFDHAQMLWPWAFFKVLDALGELVKLLPKKTGSVMVYQGTAAKIPMGDKSVRCIVVDPPYAENVMYAEVSDFFYVWLKRILGDIYPDAFRSELTDKAEEAVSNPARFKGFKQGAKAAARQDYESKMEACFREMHRVLSDDGVMTVMFTHRESEAWGALATALMRAGFTFRASWPVHTEPGEKFAKREKGVLKTTVLLVCHKRLAEKPGVWEYIRDELRDLAEEKISEFSKLGIDGPDLQVSVYGPVLGRLADYYPVKTATGEEINPSGALHLVAEVLNERLLREENIRGVDNQTAAYLNLLKNFPSGVADDDSARLATIYGGNITLNALDVRGGLGLVKREKGKVVLLSAKDRVGAATLDPSDAKSLLAMIDMVHAAIIRFEHGVGSVHQLLHERGLQFLGSPFLNVLEAYARYAERVGRQGFAKDAAMAKPLLSALGRSSGFIQRRGESLDHYSHDS